MNGTTYDLCANDRFSGVSELPGLKTAADPDADQPCARSRRLIWPVLRAIFPPKLKKAAHVWRTWPLLRVGLALLTSSIRL